MGKTEHIPADTGRHPSNELALRQPYLLQTAIARQQEEEDEANALTLSDLLQMVMKHKWTLLLVMLVSVAIAGVNTFLLRPTYRATAVLQIERAPARIVDFQGGSDVDQMAVDESIGLKTQYELLRSRSLAERVIDDLQLDRSKTAVAPGAKATPAPAAPGASNGYIDRILSGYRKLSTPSTQDAQFLGREAVVGSFLGALSIDPIQNSRLVRVSVDNADPALAARVANATVQTFVSLGQERRIESSSYAKVFLEDQIKQVKGRLEDSERKLQQYAQQKQILALDDKTNVVNQSYLDFAAALSKAEQDRIKAEALYNEVKANPERALQSQESKTLQTLKEAKAKVEVEYQQNLRIYKPDYPKMIQMRAQITQIDDQIKSEHGNVQSLVKAQFDAAASQERQLRERLNQTRREVLTTQDNSIDLNLLRREVDTNRQIYDSLLQRLKQIGISSNLTTNNISVVDAATAPLFPYKPNLQSNLVTGLGIGVFLGLCLIFLLEYMDDSIKFP
ncbi:MAG: GumC family protein, partial [Ramlibacter sp.]|nr:GumC family protein [Ramlibacter sp.]